MGHLVEYLSQIHGGIAGMGAEAVVPPHPCRKAPAPSVGHLSKPAKPLRATRYDMAMHNYSAMVASACALT